MASGSRPSEEPARAPDPYGDTASRRSRSRIRSRSRSSGWAWARSWCANRTGWAAWKWVLPGITVSGWASAWATRASITSSTPSATARTASRNHMRNRVATWSLRERPARRRPPTSIPTLSIRPRSRAPWTSSSDSDGTNDPDATSAANRSRPSSIASRSAPESRSARWSTRAWAFDARMSYRASSQSKCVDLLSAAIASAGPPENRPPHSAPVLVPCRPSRSPPSLTARGPAWRRSWSSARGG